MIKMNTPSSSSSTGGFNLSTSGSESDYGNIDYSATTSAAATVVTATTNNHIPIKTDDESSFVEDLLMHHQADSDELVIKTEVFQSLSDNDQSPAPAPPPNNIATPPYANDPSVFAPPSYHSFNNYPQVRNNSNSQFTGYVQNHHHHNSMQHLIGGSMVNGGYSGESVAPQQQSPPQSYWYQHPMKPPPPSNALHPHHQPFHHQQTPQAPFMFPPGQNGDTCRSIVYYGRPQKQPQQQMAEMLHFSNSGREARNRAEKNRRDKLNGSIQELTQMVPHVAESPRRVDKTAVLRYAAHGLRLQYVFKDSLHRKPTKPMFVTDILMKMVDGFMIGITCHGQIVLITASVEQHLGHCQTDLYGQNITQITHPDDHNILKTELVPQDLNSLFDIQPEDESGEPRTRTAEEEEQIDKRLREDRRTFTIRMSRAVPRSEPPCYEFVKIDGCFRRADSAPRGVKTSTFPSGMQLIRRARGRDESFQLHNISGNDIIFVGMARIVRAPRIQVNFTEGNLFEYKTRHLIDGRIVDCDTRISLVAGYMPVEVKDLSPFSFMHEDDVRWVIVALRQMYDSSSEFGESCYRLVGRNGKFVYLRTRGYLEVNQDIKNVRSFICVNTLISEEEGIKALMEMKKRFAIMVNMNEELRTTSHSSSEGGLASENPHQLEKAVLCLIKDLPNGEEVNAKTKGNGKNGYGERNSRTPPVAYIPPDSETVKSSISKSVSVIYEKIGIGKRQSSCSPSPANSIKSPSSQSSNDEVFEEQKHQQQQQLNRPSVLQSSKVQIKQEYSSRVPPLPTNNCDCYFNNNGSCSKCNPQQDLSPATSSLKRPCDYLSDSSESGAEFNRKRSRATPPIVCEDSPQSAYQLSHSDQRILDIESDRRSFNMPTSEQLQLEGILDQDITEVDQQQPNVLLNIKSENESSPGSNSSVRSPMNNMYYIMNNETDLKPR